MEKSVLVNHSKNFLKRGSWAKWLQFKFFCNYLKNAEKLNISNIYKSIIIFVYVSEPSFGIYIQIS